MGIARALGVVVVAVAFTTVAACSSSSSSDPDPGTGDGGSSGGPGADDAGGDGRAPLPASGCKLGALEGVAAVTPTFAFFDPPASVPATMTGGKPSGSYVVTSAKVYLPTNTKSVAHPDKSTGTLVAWSVFDGASYRLFLHAKLTIDTSIGPQPQGNDVASQGTFTVSGATLAIDYACDASQPDPKPQYSFTDDGSGKSTLVIQSQTSFGDGYLELEGTKR